MSILQYLLTLNWPRYMTLYAVAYETSDVDMNMQTAKNDCPRLQRILRTRCLFSTNLTGFILNRTDDWLKMTLSHLMSNTQRYKAINIEIDVERYLDHMFILVYTDGAWYIVQSYINRYSTRVEPINIGIFLNTLLRWTKSGVKNSEWRHYFHADMPSTRRAIPHIYGVTRLISQDVSTAIPTIQGSIARMNTQRYQCVLAPYS